MVINSKTRASVAALFLILLVLAVPAMAETTSRTYFEEDTAVPFTVWALFTVLGVVLLIISILSGFSRNAGITIVIALISLMFLSVAAFAAPVTGFFDYTIIENTTSGGEDAIPTVWLAFQPWMMWLLWGLATIAFLMFVLGILNLFREQKAAEDMYWI